MEIINRIIELPLGLKLTTLSIITSMVVMACLGYWWFPLVIIIIGIVYWFDES